MDRLSLYCLPLNESCWLYIESNEDLKYLEKRAIFLEMFATKDPIAGQWSYHQPKISKIVLERFNKSTNSWIAKEVIFYKEYN